MAIDETTDLEVEFYVPAEWDAHKYGAEVSGNTFWLQLFKMCHVGILLFCIFSSMNFEEGAARIFIFQFLEIIDAQFLKNILQETIVHRKVYRDFLTYCFAYFLTVVILAV